MESPHPIEESIVPAATPRARTFIDFLNSLFVTVLSIVVGGAITVFGTIFVLEAIHTKILVVDLVVASLTITAGAVAAISLRRAMLKPKDVKLTSTDKQL